MNFVLLKNTHLRPLLLLGIGVCALQPASSLAINYGTYESRALAMGGTTVGVGNTSQAAFYNPALLAFHEGDEDKTRDGRAYVPSAVVQAAKAVDSALTAVNDNLDTTIRNAITVYNNDNSNANAAAVAQGSRDLRDALDKIANKDLTFDAFFGLSASEPSDHEGGAFYMGVRAIGAGTSQVTPADLALLDEYIDVTEQIAAGAAPAAIAALHPNLINAANQIIDRTNTLTSSADVSGLAISEWGLALAKEFNFWGQAISFGITPKMMRVDAYRDQATFSASGATSVNNQLDQFTDTKSTHMAFNADIGIAAIIAEHYRVGFATKDAVAKDFATKQVADSTGAAKPDLLVKLHPRSRMGLGYVNNNLSIGLDYDLAPSTPIASEAPSQDISLGIEYVVFSNIALRAGYKQDKTGLRANVTSTGIGYRYRRFVMDIAYAQSTDMQGGGLQLGWTF